MKRITWIILTISVLVLVMTSGALATPKGIATAPGLEQFGGTPPGLAKFIENDSAGDTGNSEIGTMGAEGPDGRFEMK